MYDTAGRCNRVVGQFMLHLRRVLNTRTFQFLSSPPPRVAGRWYHEIVPQSHLEILPPRRICDSVPPRRENAHRQRQSSLLRFITKISHIRSSSRLRLRRPSIARSDSLSATAQRHPIPSEPQRSDQRSAHKCSVRPVHASAKIGNSIPLSARSAQSVLRPQLACHRVPPPYLLHV